MPVLKFQQYSMDNAVTIKTMALPHYLRTQLGIVISHGVDELVQVGGVTSVHLLKPYSSISVHCRHKGREEVVGERKLGVD